MSIGTRNGQSYFWSLINDLFDQDVPSRENFIKATIHRLQDNIIAGRDLVFNLAQQLGSTNAGTSAVQRGSVAMGTLAFYDPSSVPTGSLDGLTLILETDLAGPVTVTFAQPTSPAHVATQINTQAAALGLVASVDTGVDPNTGAVVSANVGKLLLVRPSGATADLIVYGAGTANAVLGLPLIDTTVSGAGTVNDGLSRIGGAAIGSIPAGTLRSILVSIASAAVGALPTSGGTMTGSIVFSGATTQPQYRLPYDLPDTAAHTMTLAYDFATIPNVSQVSIYTLPNPTAAGRWIVVRRLNVGSGNLARVVRVDSTILASFPNSGDGAVLFVSESDGGSGYQWTAFMAAGDATAVN